MTILQAIERANSLANIPNFSFANLAEFNSFMDTFNHIDYPCHVLEPFTTTQVWLNGRVKTTVTLNGWMLKRIDSDTTNFRSAKIEETHLQPMREKAMAFIKQLLHDEDTVMVDPEVDTITVTIRPEYALLPARVFGVSYTLTLPVVEGIC